MHPLLATDKYKLAHLISEFEDSRREASHKRKEIIDELEKSAASSGSTGSGNGAVFAGFTGSPGAGKSTLLGRVCLRLIEMDPSIRVAVIAVDPSSEISGGALLGDRTRVRFPVDESRLFFRSQASDLKLGGVGPATFQACRLLYYLFDLVIIETVGIGQSEIEIQHLSDRVYLVLQPMAGDQIQFLKAGIMEIPDVFIINKSDEVEAARKTYYALRASLSMNRPGSDEKLKLIQTSAVSGSGIDELCNDLLELKNQKNNSPAETRSRLREREKYHFEQWVKEEFGRSGIAELKARGGADEIFSDAISSDEISKRISFDQAQIDFSAKMGP